MEGMSISEGEARFGKLAMRPWGDEAPWGYQGAEVGIYDKDGDFHALAIVEEDRMNLEKDEDAPGGWSFESQMKVLAWADEGDRDPDAEVAWVGPEPA